MQAKIEERGLLDPKQGFPQTNALDLMAYREVFDLDYAMPIQRDGGITLSVMTNGGELEWLARDLLQGSTVDGIKFFNDEYVEIMDRYPGEFCADGQCKRPRSGVPARCRGDDPPRRRQGHCGGVQLWRQARIASSLTAPRRSGCGSLPRPMTSWCTFIQPDAIDRA